jgi:hypothetical protein
VASSSIGKQETGSFFVESHGPAAATGKAGKRRAPHVVLPEDEQLWEEDARPCGGASPLQPLSLFFQAGKVTSTRGGSVIDGTYDDLDPTSFHFTVVSPDGSTRSFAGTFDYDGTSKASQAAAAVLGDVRAVRLRGTHTRSIGDVHDFLGPVTLKLADSPAPHPQAANDEDEKQAERKRKKAESVAAAVAAGVPLPPSAPPSVASHSRKNSVTPDPEKVRQAGLNLKHEIEAAAQSAHAQAEAHRVKEVDDAKTKEAEEAKQKQDAELTAAAEAAAAAAAAAAEAKLAAEVQAKAEADEVAKLKAEKEKAEKAQAEADAKAAADAAAKVQADLALVAAAKRRVESSRPSSVSQSRGSHSSVGPPSPWTSPPSGPVRPPTEEELLARHAAEEAATQQLELARIEVEEEVKREVERARIAQQNDSERSRPRTPRSRERSRRRKLEAPPRPKRKPNDGGSPSRSGPRRRDSSKRAYSNRRVPLPAARRRMINRRRRLTVDDASHPMRGPGDVRAKSWNWKSRRRSLTFLCGVLFRRARTTMP